MPDCFKIDINTFSKPIINKQHKVVYLCHRLGLNYVRFYVRLVPRLDLQLGLVLS